MITPGRFANTVIYVTGSGSGIGKAIALRLAGEGAAVGIATIDEAEANAVAGECRELGATVGVAVSDLGTAEGVTSAHSSLLEQIGAADVLVNNVGVGIEAPFFELTDEQFDRTMAVNFMSNVRMTRLVLPAMLERGKGVIVNLGSVQGEIGWPGANAYSASKGAIAAWSRQLANEFGTRGIRSNTVLPGAVLTPMQLERIVREGETSRTRSANLHIIPRLEQPEEVAAAVSFLASDESSFITASELRVDGGSMTKAHSYVGP